MICPYAFDEPIGSGVPSLLDGRYWCMGHIDLGMSPRRRRCPEDCPVCFGPWGAWRAVLGDVAFWAMISAWTRRHPNEWDELLCRSAIEEILAAVGWSP